MFEISFGRLILITVVALAAHFTTLLIRAYVDARLPQDPAAIPEAEVRLRALGLAAHEQFPGILLRPPTFEGRMDPRDGAPFFRTKFRIWPGQGAIIEGPVKSAMLDALKGLDDRYADWMVAVHYRSEPRDDAPDHRLPRPGARDGARERS